MKSIKPDFFKTYLSSSPSDGVSFADGSDSVFGMEVKVEVSEELSACWVSNAKSLTFWRKNNEIKNVIFEVIISRHNLCI